MARRVVVTLVDDYDGTSAATESVAFALDGAAYEIDLSEKNASSLRTFLGQWIPHARRVGKAPHSRNTQPRITGSRRLDVAAIRAWAKDNGRDISTRGRIPTEVVEAYRAATEA
ncbi:Lsr2 family protein [Nocardia sp. NPDC057227]|uniref:histone-like nucleoid-structuring protein Lsr2 n=1 Tax=Nocardia sp. NPDC057227 TaxID=3346056 RepID=UPI00362CD5DA